MNTIELDVLDTESAVAAIEQSAATRPTATLPAAVIGILIGFKDEGCTPLVLFAGQPGSAAVAAASVVDVRGTYIGRQVVLLFENGNPRRPIITGLVRTPQAWPRPEQPGQVEVDADGERLIVSAKEQLVFRCGEASITLTKAGKVLIEGKYLSSRSSGLNRIRGGSIQLN